jgi:hypothetical protein
VVVKAGRKKGEAARRLDVPSSSWRGVRRCPPWDKPKAAEVRPGEVLSAYAKPIWEFSSRHLFNLGNPFASPYRRNLQLRSHPDYASMAKSKTYIAR